MASDVHVTDAFSTCDSVRAGLSIVNSQWYQLHVLHVTVGGLTCNYCQLTMVSVLCTTCGIVMVDLFILNTQWYQVCVPCVTV